MASIWTGSVANLLHVNGCGEFLQFFELVANDEGRSQKTLNDMFYFNDKNHHATFFYTMGGRLGGGTSRFVRKKPSKILDRP